MKKHASIALFVPHFGCPNMCSFCNQHSITKASDNITVSDVERAVQTAIHSSFGGADDTEIAFFGGSFTMIPREKMCELLAAAHKYVRDKTVRGIRISTRPDGIDDDILKLLKSYGVTAIELGAQSMDNKVLRANMRGHMAEDIAAGCEKIKAQGFELGLQMMTGLYSDSDAGALMTAQRIAALKPKTVRIYPTIVLKNTPLEKLVKSGEYMPQSLENAVLLCAKLYLLFTQQNIKVIRLGLHELERNDIVAGPWHPAFSELCMSEIYKNLLIQKLGDKGHYTLQIARGEMSKVIGQKRVNKNYFENLGYSFIIEENESVKPLDIEII